MAKKLKKPHAEPEVKRLSMLDDTEHDPRPTSSPYASIYVNVFFGAAGRALKVPKCILNKCSNLPPYDSSWDNHNLRLPHVPEEVGHIFVHHLFTGAFQCLAPHGSNALERRTAEFTTCIRAYTVAQKYNVSLLAEQARAEIDRLGQTISFPVILSALADAYHVAGTDDGWLSDYLTTQMKLILNDQKSMKAIMATEVARRSSIAEMLLHSVLCLRLQEFVPDYSLDSPDFDAPRQDLNPQKIPSSYLDESFVHVYSTVHGVPVEEVPVEEVPVEEVPVEEVPVEEAPVEGVPVDDISAAEADLIPASDPDSSFIVTPASSTTYGFATVAGTQPDASPSLLPKRSSKKAKKYMKKKHQPQDMPGSNELNTGCEVMEEHMRPGIWMFCHVCRGLVQGLAAEASPADKEATTVS